MKADHHTATFPREVMAWTQSPELQVAPGRSAFLSSQWKDVGRSWRSQADGLDM